MNNPVTIEAAALEKVATTIASSAQHLEKAAAEQKAYAEAVPTWVDHAVDAGVLSPNARDATVNELIDGGITKVSSFVDLLIRSVGTRTLGSSANEKSANVSNSLSAHEQFAQSILN